MRRHTAGLRLRWFERRLPVLIVVIHGVELIVVDFIVELIVIVVSCGCHGDPPECARGDCDGQYLLRRCDDE